MLPDVRGHYEFNCSLKSLSYLKVGGCCDVLFRPADVADLVEFLRLKTNDLPVTVLGNMSNVLISDSGIRGCAVLLNNLNKINFFDDFVTVEAGGLLSNFVKVCARQNRSSCEKLFCIPGTIGGAVFMNAGIPGFEINDVLVSIDAVSHSGELKTFYKDDLKMSYRNGNIPSGFIVTAATLKTTQKSRESIFEEIRTSYSKRLKTQPITLPTCGSTFKNPVGEKAWRLIKMAGCDKLSIGGAKVSDLHCNFLINSGTATASDFSELIELIKTKVFERTGYLLEEEVKRIGGDG